MKLYYKLMGKISTIYLWHYSFLEVVPKSVFKDIYKEIKYILSHKAYKKVFCEEILFAYCKKFMVVAESRKYKWNLLTPLTKYFKDTILDELTLVHLCSELYEIESYHFKEHNSVLLKENYTVLKELCLNNKISEADLKLAQKIYLKERKR